MLKIVDTYVDVATPGRLQHPTRGGRTEERGQGTAAPRHKQDRIAPPTRAWYPERVTSESEETPPNARTPLTATVHRGVVGLCANDPSAGSPTETLLRLLLPLSDKVH